MSQEMNGGQARSKLDAFGGGNDLRQIPERGDAIAMTDAEREEVLGRQAPPVIGETQGTKDCMSYWSCRRLSESD